MKRTFRHKRKGYCVKFHVTKKRKSIADKKGFVCLGSGATQELGSFLVDFEEVSDV